MGMSKKTENKNTDLSFENNEKKPSKKAKILVFIKSCICPCIFKKVDCCNNCNFNIHVMGQ